MSALVSQRSAHTWALPVHDARFANLSPERLFSLQSSVNRLAWLDSSGGSGGSGEGGGWSYLACNPICQREIQCCSTGAPRSFWYSLARSAKRVKRLHHSVPDGPPFCGGWIGFLAYDAAFAGPSLLNPPSRFSFFDVVLAYEHVRGRWWCAGVSLDEPAPEKISGSLAYKAALALEQFAPAFNPCSGNSFRPVPRRATSTMTPRQYREAVERALAYIRDGHIYQINLAQRFSVAADYPAQSFYLSLRQQSPAAFGAFLGSGLAGGGQAICSVSPELFLRVRGRSVITRPIKGTRPLGNTEAQTAAAARELEENAKERAELNMIVDLERNDLGRACEFGSVHVDDAGSVERLPTLLHRVAAVSGTLRAGCGPATLLRATFPGGSITGAPKIRAMEIIRELEPEPRGVYCGAIGWLAPDGDMEMSIAIRTAIHDGERGQIHYASGSGIVADSDPAREYDETLLKASAFFRAANATLQE